MARPAPPAITWCCASCRSTYTYTCRRQAVRACAGLFWRMRPWPALLLWCQLSTYADSAPQFNKSLRPETPGLLAQPRRRTQAKTAAAGQCYDNDAWLKKNLKPDPKTRKPFTCAQIKAMPTKRWPDGTVSQTGCEQMEHHRNRGHPNGLSWVCGCSCPQPQLTRATCEDFNPWLRRHAGGYTCGQIKKLKFCDQLVRVHRILPRFPPAQFVSTHSDFCRIDCVVVGGPPPAICVGVWLFVLWVYPSP